MYSNGAEKAYIYDDFIEINSLVSMVYAKIFPKFKVYYRAKTTRTAYLKSNYMYAYY